MAKIKTRNSDSHKTRPRDVHKRAFEKVYWPYIPIVLIIGVLLSVGAQTGSLAAYAKHPGGRVLAYANSMTIGSLLADTNAQRSANGVGGLSLNPKLDAAAQANADDMAARDYWSHYTPDGNPPWIWVTNQGYSYQKLGQNLATGFNDEQSTVDGWMASPPHRENLLDPAYTEVGFGYANVPNYTAAGGGPMTVVVAFYGEPQVLAASTGAPAPAGTTSTPPASPAPQPVAQSQAAAASPDQTAKKPATTTTVKSDLAPSVKSSRLQLAIGNSTYTGFLTVGFVTAAVAIGILWLRRHGRALHGFLIKGERYAISHPLTDLGLLVIASLLFILSQTAGLIQ
jgi:hypothetical protein